jgi:hypothetical protein
VLVAIGVGFLMVPGALPKDGLALRRTDSMQPVERALGLDEFPSLDELWAIYLCWKGIESEDQRALVAQPYHTDGSGNPLYTYSLKQGIEDGFPAPYKVIRVVSDVDALDLILSSHAGALTTHSAGRSEVMGFAGAWGDMGDFDVFEGDLLVRRRSRAPTAAHEQRLAVFTERLRQNHRSQP